MVALMYTESKICVAWVKTASAGWAFCQLVNHEDGWKGYGKGKHLYKKQKAAKVNDGGRMNQYI